MKLDISISLTESYFELLIERHRPSQDRLLLIFPGLKPISFLVDDNYTFPHDCLREKKGSLRFVLSHKKRRTILPGFLNYSLYINKRKPMQILMNNKDLEDLFKTLLILNYNSE